MTLGSLSYFFFDFTFFVLHTATSGITRGSVSICSVALSWSKSDSTEDPEDPPEDSSSEEEVLVREISVRDLREVEVFAVAGMPSTEGMLSGGLIMLPGSTYAALALSTPRPNFFVGVDPCEGVLLDRRPLPLATESASEYLALEAALVVVPPPP
uniref:Putative secreted protein n=1 Tax=Anopheles triannulatus TaxID=58253 RepID=A0A2M4B1E2_9DIPT